jgi:hypothetical protein
MKAAPIALLALACALPIAASAQWMYLDKDGRKVFSDKAPPPEIAPERILKGPKGSGVGAAAMTPTAQPVSVEATQATAPAGGLKPLGKDKSLEDRKKQLAAAEADKRKADEEKVAAARADNCQRAREARTAYAGGQRISKMDSKGDRSFVDDAERASETKRLDQVIARDCGQ